MALARSRSALSARNPRARTRKTSRRDGTAEPLLVVSLGCPAGVGPEVSVAAAARLDGPRCVLVGDPDIIYGAAEMLRVPRERFVPFEGVAPPPGKIAIHGVGPALSERDVVPGRPSRAAGVAQLEYIEQAYALARAGARRALVTGPVSKAAIANSGLPRARRFLGHTEWLGELDGARATVMCFAADQLVTSLVTTHLPLSRVPRALTPAGVRVATIELVRLLKALGHRAPRVAVASLNPHAGESELLGDEERRAIVPGLRAASRELGRSAHLIGPVGAETAYRKMRAGEYAGVVAMYHDQATIPMKLVAFGDAVNVTMGLRVVRTSVDHGTAYDIAWQGRADASGMLSAMRLAAKLVDPRSAAG